MKEVRINILKQINEIEAKHCVGCQLKFQKGNKQRACKSFCEIGREIAEIGKPLYGKKEKPKKSRYGSKTRIIMDLIEKSYRQVEIQELTGFNSGTISSAVHRYKNREYKGGA